MMTLLKAIPVLIGAILIGKWFQDEVKKSVAVKAPWYKPYLSVPGVIIILLVILFPIVFWIMKH